MTSGPWKEQDRSSKSPQSGHLLLSGIIASIASSLGMDEEEKDADPLTTKIKVAIKQMDRGDHDKAEITLHEALQVAVDSDHQSAIDYIYVVLADNALAARELEKAEKLYKEVLRRLMSNNVKEDDESVIEISLQLATIYAERHDYENADEGFAFCIQRQRKRLQSIDMSKELDEGQKNSVALFGMILDWYSKYCQLRKDYVRAQKYTEEAYQMSLKALGELNNETLVLMSDLAVLAEKNGDLDRAIELLKGAVDHASTVKSSELPVFFYNLGTCFLKKRDGHNANYCCLRALKLADESQGTEIRAKARRCVVRSHSLMSEAKLARED